MEPAHTRIKPAHTRIKPAHPHIKPAHTRIYDQPYIERGRLGEIEEERARESERERARARAEAPRLLASRRYFAPGLARSTHPTPSEGPRTQLHPKGVSKGDRPVVAQVEPTCARALCMGRAHVSTPQTRARGTGASGAKGAAGCPAQAGRRGGRGSRSSPAGAGDSPPSQRRPQTGKCLCLAFAS